MRRLQNHHQSSTRRSCPPATPEATPLKKADLPRRTFLGCGLGCVWTFLDRGTVLIAWAGGVSAMLTWLRSRRGPAVAPVNHRRNASAIGVTFRGSPGSVSVSLTKANLPLTPPRPAGRCASDRQSFVIRRGTPQLAGMMAVGGSASPDAGRLSKYAPRKSRINQPNLTRFVRSAPQSETANRGVDETGG